LFADWRLLVPCVTAHRQVAAVVDILAVCRAVHDMGYYVDPYAVH
jgi:hypothetical protein